MLEELMAEFGVEPGATLMIGDTTHDLLMARNAGVAALGVAYGAHPRASLEAETPLFCAGECGPVGAMAAAAGMKRHSGLCASGDLVLMAGMGCVSPSGVTARTVRPLRCAFEGRVHAYLNRCSHLPVKLDWQEGSSSNASGLYLICATHGALYAPDTGHCLSGRCMVRGWWKLPLVKLTGGSCCARKVGKVSDGNDVNWERKVLEKLALEALAEQKRGRRWGIFFKLLGFGYLALLLVVALDLGKGEHVADGAKYHGTG
jgi:nitrite reductase/ring-hydroxylating ferredoxin subunit